jgi:hypothetical protein
MSLYAWTVYGPAMIVGDTSAQMVEVQALGSCDSTFILELYVMDTNGCASLCSMTVALIDTLPPVITDVPDSLFVDCFDDVPVASIDSVTVTDNCNGNVYVTVSDSVYNDTLCPNQLSIIRTWTATDTCGNYAMATQFINVFDSIPPMIADVPDSLYVECFSEVPVASVDSVTVTDNCDMNPFVTVSDSIFNDTLCPNQLSIIRTWTATDTCGNYSMASQFINVFDSIAPVLYDVPVDTGYCCPDSVPPPANVTAFDNCDGQVIVAFTEFVYDSTGPYMFFINRTWTAEDTCQNFASATQIIEVNDSLYPGGGNVFIPSNDDFVLYFNTSPNPFTNQLNIEFSLAQSSDVILDVYDFTGIKIGTIFEGNVPALEGVKHEMSPDAGMKNGIYMIVLRTQYGIASKRVLLMK